MLDLILMLILCYLLGAIPFSYFVAKLKGVDLTKVGSGNIGATNVYRSVGKMYGVIAFFFDAGKGFFVVLLVNILTLGNPILTVLGATLAILGHTFSPFVGFKGGKGVATGVGVLFFLQPVVAIIGLVLELVIIKVTGYVSLASIVSGLVIFLLMLMPVFNTQPVYSLFVLVVVAYIIYKHKGNIKRLIKGQETKI
ncbi:MAG: glycerol-3-phosphate 1-O-acyltransferase PlsY [Candidatus Margulisbacteria bacterium]|nr:glycerol-3-phosphate 1-O-acyltransferase PlsY [Candidatus Margulisiibacteriota bacterium]